MGFKNGIKNSTLTIYEKNYNKLSKDIMGDIEDDFRWLLDYDKVMAEINKSPSLHTRKNKINTVIVYLNMIDDLKKSEEEIVKKYNNDIGRLTKEINDDYNQNVKNEKQKENWMTYEELNNIVNKLKGELPKQINDYPNYRKLMHYLMLSIHIEIPLRNDMADAKIYTEKEFNKLEEDKETNYVVLNGRTGQIILNNYKTAQSYGRKKINLSKNLFSIFKKYYPIIKERSKDNYIFIDINGDKLNRNQYTLLFNNLFKDYDKKISSSMIRHIVISHKFPINENEMKEREQLADIMGHSVNEALKVYSKSTN